MVYRYLHHDAPEYESSHENLGHASWDIWHIVGVILGILVLLAIIGFIIQCVRGRSAYGVQPGVGYGAQQGVYY